MSLSDIHLSAANNQLVITHSPSQRTIHIRTQPVFLAKLMHILARIFPCFCLGISAITINNHIYYVAQSHLQKHLRSLSHPSNLKDPAQNATALKTLALSYFNLSSVSKTLPIQNIPEDATHLSTAFLALKDTVKKSSGYHVQLTKDPSQNTRTLTIQAVGVDNAEMMTPNTIRQCTCCQTGFEHTFKTGSIPFVTELSEKIAPYDMFAVVSPSGNLLLVPDTQKAHIQAAEFPHLFHLNASQLQKVFAAALEIDAFLHSRMPSYTTKIAWHNGVAGNQTMGILHVRIEGLRN